LGNALRTTVPMQRRTAGRPRAAAVRRGAAVTVAVMLTAAVAPGVAAAGDLGTDRDAFTPSPSVVPPGTVLSEGSYVFIDNATGLPTNNYPEYLARIGRSERFEWRFGVNYGVGSQGNVVTSVEVGEGTLDGTTLYESSILYGFKLGLTERDGLVPESCFIMEGSTPTYGDAFGTVPVATAVAGWDLPAGWELAAAIRYAYSEGRSAWCSRWSPSVVVRLPVTDRWQVHAEWFDSVTQGLVVDTNRGFFSPGTHYMLTERLEIGLRVGWGITADAAPFFSDAGFGWRW
jgi:hypothetical protein